MKDEDVGCYRSSHSEKMVCSTLTNEINHTHKWVQLQTIKVNGGYESQLMFGN